MVQSWKLNPNSFSLTWRQWHNRHGAGVRVPPDIFHQEIFAELPGKEGQGRKGKRREKEGKLKGKRWKIENGRGESMKISRGFFFFFFFFVTFCSLFFFFLSLFETNEICLGFTKMDNLPGKSIFHTGKKSGKMTLPPLKNIPLMPLHQGQPSKGTWGHLDTT